MGKIAIFISTWLPAVAGAAMAMAQASPCGLKSTDWCAPAAGDPCGRHRNVAACRADAACFGRPYDGESIVACTFDRRGFGANCPTVGCTSVPPKH